MRTIKKNVYYCEFCGKRSLSASHMTKHENGCTLNIDRECKLCGYTEHSHDLKTIVEAFKSRFKIIEESYFIGDCEVPELKLEWSGAPVTLKEIKQAVNQCPNCTLSVIRLAGFTHWLFGFEFDYKKENKAWFDSHQSEELYNYFHP